MTRRRFRQIDGELVEIPVDAPPSKPMAPAIFGDLPDYTSPVDGRVVSGRKQRRDDLRRNGCRPYEGFEQEQKEANRHRAYMDKKADERISEAVEKTYYQLRDGMTPRPE